MEKICKTCGIRFKARKERIYCSLRCYNIVAKGQPKPIGFGKKISKALKGKPKPWHRGKNNPNYNNAVQGTPEVHKRFLEAVKARGQPWTTKHKKEHSKRMLGPTNKMRGKHHTKETRKKISIIKRKQYAAGKVKFKSYKRSKAELEIGRFLTDININFKSQYHIKNSPYIYDFYFPDHNLILEYQGDYWHANPNYYMPGTLINIRKNGYIPVESIWKRDAHKKDLAEHAGYIVLYLWEDVYKNHGIKSLKEILSLYFL